jgi:hypothetical protein
MRHNRGADAVSTAIHGDASRRERRSSVGAAFCDPLQEHGYVIHLWKNSINVLPMGNPGTDYHFLLFVYRYADPIVSNADLVFSGKPSHLLKISEIERILTPEIFKDDFLRLSLDTRRKLSQFLQEAFFVFKFPHLVSKTHKSV